MIQTVCGPIEAAELGVTMCHEHLCVDLSGVRNDTDSVFGDSELVRSEMALARDAGVESFIEVSCIAMGRDVAALERMSRALGVNIVCSTGFYLDCYHPDWVRQASVEEIAELFSKEFSEGIDGTGIRPGVIGEIAGEAEEITPSEHNVMVAAARVASEVGCAVTTHCQLGHLAHEQADLLTGNGMSPEKIVLGHLDLANDLDYYKSILDRGVNIGFDTCGKVAYLADEVRADNLARLVELGYAGQIMLSTDISRKSYMKAMGGYGYANVMERILPMLRERGVAQEAIDTMLVSNPARVFDIEGGLS